MTRKEALDSMKLLAAMESWAFSNKTMLPDYLHEDLCNMMVVLENIILKEKND